MSQNQIIDHIDWPDFDGEVLRGKVRDSFIFGSQNLRAIVTTDRISAFDFSLGCVPFKGQVLNQIAAFWFKKLDQIGVPHHFVDSPDPNISLCRSATPLPVEIIVRGYLTGSTRTSSWWNYQHNNCEISGIKMPSQMAKNQKFESPLLTPSTKGAGGRDENISESEIVSRGLVPEPVWSRARELALRMFEFGQAEAAKRGLILVDTKYEMGLDAAGELMVIDEVHTPDSSRYWEEGTYLERFAAGLDPDPLDKEFVRASIVQAGYDPSSAANPAEYFTPDLQQFASEKYLELFRRMTGRDLDLSASGGGSARVLDALKSIKKTRLS